MYWKNLADGWKEAIKVQLTRMEQLRAKTQEFKGSMDGECNSFGGVGHLPRSNFYQAYVSGGVTTEKSLITLPSVNDMLLLENKVIKQLTELISDKEGDGEVIFADQLTDILDVMLKLKQQMKILNARLCSETKRTYDADTKRNLIILFTGELDKIIQDFSGGCSKPTFEGYDNALLEGSRQEALNAFKPYIESWPIMTVLCYIEQTIRRTHDECLPNVAADANKPQLTEQSVYAG